MRFSDMLRELAETRNLTQKKIAADLGIPASTVGGYFQGTSEPDLEMVTRLAAYFNCTVDYLLGNKSPQTSSFKEDKLIYLFRNMDAKQQDLYLALGTTIASFEK